jgi:RimJ/RimL family protein N-acetyltransferase
VGLATVSPPTAGVLTGTDPAPAQTLHYRPIAADDEERLADFHSRLLPETVYLRFFNAHPRLSANELHHFTHVDGRDRFAMVAVDEADRIIAVARYDRTPGADDAEVAFVVDDSHQGHGLGAELLRRLVAEARGNGIRRFVADTMVGNQKMLGVFRQSGLPEVVSLEDGLFHVLLDL